MNGPDPSDLPPSGAWDHEAMLETLRAAGKRIQRDRRRMSVEDAEDIVHMEARRRGITLPHQFVVQVAHSAHRGPFRSFLWIVGRRLRARERE